MGAILAWPKMHFAIDRFLRWGKGGYELAEARSKAIKAGVEARMVSRQEAFANLELEMHKLDGKVKAQYGYSASLVDPNVYVDKLKAAPDLVTEVLMKRRSEQIWAQRQIPSRWKRER